jgi:shikimate kinase
VSTSEPRRLFLIGLMGSGKSTVGRQLAERLDCRYVDNDTTIAEMAGRSTVDLAAAGGDVLHEWEARYAHYLADVPAPLVAGIPASAADRPDELQMLAHRGRLIYLRCDTDTLVRRVTADAPRPWLTDDVRDKIEAMFTSRDPILCSTAAITVDATMTSTTVVNELLQWGLSWPERTWAIDGALRTVRLDQDSGPDHPARDQG